MQQRLGTGLVLATALSGCPAPAPQPPVTTTKTATAAATSVVVAEPEARWLAVSAPPSASQLVPWAKTPAGRVGIDPSGTRWLRGSSWSHAANPDRFRYALLRYQASLGLVAIGHDGVVRMAAEPLGAFETRGALPAGSDPAQVRIHGGGLTVGKHVSVDGGKSWSAVSPHGDRAPLELAIDKSGVGIGVFTPEALGLTKDGGHSWAALTPRELPVGFLQPVASDQVVVGDAHYWSPGETTLRACQPTACKADASTMPLKAAPTPTNDNRPRRASVLEATLDGDELVVVELGDRVEQRARIGRGRLGEGVRYRQVELGPTAPPQLISASCSGTVVFGWGKQLWVAKPDQQPRHFDLAVSMTALVMAGPDRALVVGSEAALWLDTNAASQAAPPIPLPGLTAGYSDVQAVSTCRDKGPQAAWVLMPARHRRQCLAFKIAASTAHATPCPFDGGSLVAMGVDTQDRLVFAIDGDASKSQHARLAIVDPQAQAEVVTLPFVTALSSHPTRLVSLSINRGLLLDRQARAYQTDDGGKSWRRVPGPPAQVLRWRERGYQRDYSMQCGKTGCQFGDGLVRLGWQAPSLPDDPPAPAPPRPTL